MMDGPQKELIKNNYQEKKNFIKFLRVSKNWFKSQLNNSMGREAMNYLISQRKLNNKIIAEFELGLCT